MRLLCAVLCALCLFSGNPASAEDLNTILKRVDDFVQQKNYSKAMEELDWARKEVEKMHVKRVQEFLPDNLAGYTGQKFDANSALGFSNIERDYKQGKKDVKLSLTGGSGGGAAALGGLAQLGRMAAMFGGNTPGNETIRIQGRTATLETGESSASMTVMLDSGSILRLDGSSGVSSEDLKSIVEGIKIEELDSYLKGSK